VRFVAAIVRRARIHADIEDGEDLLLGCVGVGLVTGDARGKCRVPVVQVRADQLILAAEVVVQRSLGDADIVEDRSMPTLRMPSL
jgi:hypothetical protein